MLGLVFAFLGIFLGHLFKNAYLDGVASIAIGLLLMSVAGILASRTMGLLLGEGVTPEELKDIRRRVESDPAVERAGDILTHVHGPARSAREHGGLLCCRAPRPSRCTRRSAALKPT